jgi:hypothetical protein
VFFTKIPLKQHYLKSRFRGCRSSWVQSIAIIIELMATPRGGIDQIRPDMEQIINENGLREYQRVLTDESLIGN